MEILLYTIMSKYTTTSLKKIFYIKIRKYYILLKAVKEVQSCRLIEIDNNSRLHVMIYYI